MRIQASRTCGTGYFSWDKMMVIPWDWRCSSGQSMASYGISFLKAFRFTLGGDTLWTSWGISGYSVDVSCYYPWITRDELGRKTSPTILGYWWAEQNHQIIHDHWSTDDQLSIIGSFLIKVNQSADSKTTNDPHFNPNQLTYSQQIECQKT